MPVIRVNKAEVKLLARLMRAEAEGEGQKGMLLVGDVGVNRVRSQCLDFKKIRNIKQMVFQRPGGFESTMKPYFYQAARAVDMKLANRVLNGQRFEPAKYALWFFKPSGKCASSWFKQSFSGQYKHHCFYKPTQKNCPSIYS